MKGRQRQVPGSCSSPNTYCPKDEGQKDYILLTNTGDVWIWQPRTGRWAFITTFLVFDEMIEVLTVKFDFLKILMSLDINKHRHQVVTTNY